MKKLGRGPWDEGDGLFGDTEDKEECRCWPLEDSLFKVGLL